MPLFFWFDLFLEARAEILENFSLIFWEIWKHQKDILKLTDLYEENSMNQRTVTEHVGGHFWSNFLTKLPGEVSLET